METIKRIIKNVLGKTQAECKAKLAAAMEVAKGVDVSRADEYTVATWLRSWYDIYARPLRCRIHTPHLHPCNQAEARRGRTNHGQLHDAGDVSQSKRDERAEHPSAHLLPVPRISTCGSGCGSGGCPAFCPTPESAFLQQKSTENRSFRCFLELLGGFEPPTSSLPSDKMPSSRCGTRGCGRFCRKKDEVGNSLLHVFRPLVSPCGSRCGSEPPASSVWVNFLWQWNGHILRCWKQ